MLRIAVAGAGLIGRAHIAAIAAEPGCTLAAIVDPSPAAQQAGVPFHATLDALLAGPRPDAIVLATPNALHVPQALQCIAAGLPVLLEKPIATTVAEGLQLVEQVERTGARVLIGHHRAHSAIMAEACEVVASGRLGRLVAVMGSAAFCKPDGYFATAPWRSQPGGGPILINLIHEVHNLRMLCGEIIAVQALASQEVRGFAVEDTVSIGLRFANGALGSFLLSDTAACARSWEQTSGENPAYAQEDDEDCYVVTGTRGSLSVPTMRLRTHADGATPSWHAPRTHERIALQPADPIRRQMNHFAAVVRGEAAPRVSARDGLQNLRVTEAIVQAAATGQTIHLH